MSLENLPEEFRQRFAAWLRIEPRCRSADFARGIQARTADPLWMLARQWQTGEFLGEDAGSPIRVSVGYSTQPAEWIRLGDGAPIEAGQGIPLEMFVEQEQPELDYRERVRVGQEFERRLRDQLAKDGSSAAFPALIDWLRRQDGIGFPHGLPPLHSLDRATQRFVRFMRGRVVDGDAVLSGPIALPASAPLGPAEMEGVRIAVVQWYGKVCSRPSATPPPAWQPESLDYAFETNAYPDASSPAAVPEDQQQTRLLAPDYRNGTVDWYTFSAGAEGARNWETTAMAADPVVTTPTRIQVSGTALRWWAFEDANTDFGAMDVAKPDLARLLLMEFVLIYGDDWFSVPAPVSLGSLVRVDQLGVWNVFGEHTPVTPARRIDGEPTERFDLFSISPVHDPLAPGISVDGSTPRPLLYVPPVAGFRLESAPMDEVRFLRDEGANMVWGVEELVPNGLGRPIAGFDAQRERTERADQVERAGLQALVADVEARLADEGFDDDERDTLIRLARLAQARMAELEPHAASTPGHGELPRYRLATTVPENWIPFIPVQKAQAALALNGGSPPGVEFRRAKMLRNTDHARLEGEALTAAAVQAAAQRLGLPEDTFLWMIDQADTDGVPSMSRLLALGEDALLWVNEEAVPRAGLRVQLTKQRVRWVDGSTHVWLGRKVLAGRGEGASGLRFDVVGRAP